MMEEKLNQVMAGNKTYAETIKGNLQTGGQATGTPEEIREIMNQTRNDNLVQDRERKLRPKNVIIHGVQENGTEADEGFVKDFIQSLGLELVPESIGRVGNVDAAKKPLKLKMKSEEIKN